MILDLSHGHYVLPEGAPQKTRSFRSIRLVSWQPILSPRLYAPREQGTPQVSTPWMSKKGGNHREGNVLVSLFVFVALQQPI